MTGHPRNANTAESVAHEEGWQTYATVTAGDRPSLAIRFHRAGCPRIWAMWMGEGFWRSYAQTGQRLGYRDLLTVLKDPNILLDVDPENPFGKEVA